MTTTNRATEREEQLANWLRRVGAVHLHEARGPNRCSVLRMYSVGSAVFIIQIFRGPEAIISWELYIPACDNPGIVETWEAAEAYFERVNKRLLEKRL